ncbi:MAG: penicillin-binding protein [Micromonosporaceae bacterium]|nr:penicillin-binding protein [Micromonosporaceae bacterium]
MVRRRDKVAKLVLCGVLSGLVIAVLAFPAAGTLGMAANFVNTADGKVPPPLRHPFTAKTTYVYANDGHTLITAFYHEARSNVSLADVAPVMRQAIVAAEDVRFYHHGGVDPRGVARAFVVNDSAGGVRQGASTLTMQYVRNVLKESPDLTPQERVNATEDTPGRKLREMRAAVAIENHMTKDQILEKYLNVAYFGHGSYGIYSASMRYYSKPPSQLTLDEAALLAGVVQSPDTDNPVNGDRKAALARRAYVLKAMVDMKAISPAQAKAAQAKPIQLRPSTDPDDCTAVPAAHNDWGYFCDYLRTWWDQQPAFGTNTTVRDDKLNEGGYKIVTTLDPPVQAAATKASTSVYGDGDSKVLPIAVVQPGTGRVLALSVNRHYALDANAGGGGAPNNVGQLVSGSDGIAGYQAGSTFKMFTMLTALELGHPLSTDFNAPARFKSKWDANGKESCDNKWCPANDNPPWMDGDRTMWTGFGRSVNTYFVWLEQQVGSERVVAMARRLGIALRAPSDADYARHHAKDWGSFTLGTASTTPLDLANAYAAVAAGGVYCRPLPVLSVTGPDGKATGVGTPQCKRVLEPDVAAAAADAARCPVGQQSAYGECDGGTAPGVGSAFGARPVAGKTGSSENNQTESFVGFTPQAAAAGTAADPLHPSNAVGEGVSNSVDAAVGSALLAAVQGQPPENFPQPPRYRALGHG